MVNKENTVIVIVTYNPDASFINIIEIHSQIASKVIIVDNGSIADNCIHSKAIQSIPNLEIIYSQINKGIAWALNCGIKLALISNPKWILTFDQDSKPVFNILNYYNKIITLNRNIGLVGINFGPHERNIDNLNDLVLIDTLTVITSGTLHNVDIFARVGYYNEELFIDSVDFDFTLRVKQCGYRTVRITNITLEHRLGSPLVKKGVESSNHNAFRRYYMARNHIIITKRYFKHFPIFCIKKTYFFITSVIRMIIVDTDKRTKIKHTISGIIDGLKY